MEKRNGWRGRRDLRAAELLRSGGTVAFPTETVYGLGANALDAAAVAKIFEAKQRPGWDPVIVHVCDRAMLKRVAEVSRIPRGEGGSSDGGVLAGAADAAAAANCGRSRCGDGGAGAGGRADAGASRGPGADSAAGVPVAAPSANRFGRTSPTTAAHVLEDLDGRIDAVLDGGATTVGVESTVLDVGQMLIYRPGAVTAEMISSVVGEVRRFRPKRGGVERPGEPAFAGSRPAPLRSAGAARSGGGRGSDAGAVARVYSARASRLGLMLPDGWSAPDAAKVFAWGPWSDTEVLARRLFAGLAHVG